MFAVACGASALFGAVPAARAAIAVPADLAAGAGYRLAFVTRDRTPASSASITTYNSFVATQAALNADLAGTSWSAIVSTVAVDAATNAACPGCNDVPVYLLDGTRLAASTAALFAVGPLAAFNEDQFGGTVSAFTWTGSNPDGSRFSGHEAGSGYPILGLTTTLSRGWLSYGDSSSGSPLSLYALSGALFAPAAVPEPGTAFLLAPVLLGGAALRRRRAG